jgi:hypothetical protein
MVAPDLARIRNLIGLYSSMLAGVFFDALRANRPVSDYCVEVRMSPRGSDEIFQERTLELAEARRLWGPERAHLLEPYDERDLIVLFEEREHLFRVVHVACDRDLVFRVRSVSP